MNSFEDVIIALKERQAIVLKYSPLLQKARNAEITSNTLKLAENLNQIKDHLKRQFIADLLVGATRNWEGFDRIQDKPRFKQLQVINLEITFDLIIRTYNTEDLQIMNYELLKEIDQAKEIIKNNIGLFELVVGRNLSIEMIDEYFTKHTFYQYRQPCQINKPALQGLSSYNGLRTYVNLDKSDIISRIQTLVHEFNHNISRFGINPLEIRKISPEKNQNLRINQQLVEAGDWVEEKLFQKAKFVYDPFSLLLNYQKEDFLE